MRKFFLTLASFLLGGYFIAQEFKVMPLSGLNTPADEIACTRFEESLVYLQSIETDLVNDYQWNSAPTHGLFKAMRGATLSDWTGNEKFHKQSRNNLGPASYSGMDSIIVFSSFDNYGGVKGKNSKLYQMKWDGVMWSKPTVLPFCSSFENFTHPWYDPATRLLVFSSNCAGGFGGMDIWFVYRLDNGWGKPVNAGMIVNTSYHEIFPTYDLGDIIYSSNQPGGRGGYDLKRAFGDRQWNSVASLGEPFNSEGDDITLLRLTDEKWILTSARSGGEGGDDLYVIEKVFPQEDYIQFSGELSCGGQAHSSIELTITNEYGEVFSHQVCDSLGRVDMSSLRFGKGYIIQLGGIDPYIYTECVLIISDDKGNSLRQIRFNASGFANLELLPLSYSDLKLISLEDESVLRINLEGQLYTEQPGDVGRDEPITILDEEGVPVAIAYTNDSGRFRFTKVEPQAEYTFRLSKETAARHVLITDKGEKITLPVLDAEIKYLRVDPNEAIELVDEYNQKIIVSHRDLFVINRIYYEYNSSKLTGEASSQLDQIAIVMKKNPRVMLELRSHTDSRGDAAYNKALSGKRAKSAIEYLTKGGLAANRFKSEGFGEAQLLNECKDGVECSDQEHSINRRTEIRISKMPEVR